MRLRYGREELEDREVTCPKCGRVATVLQWDTYTESLCTSREMRRSYKKMFTKQASSGSNSILYACPFCEKFTKLKELKLT